MVYKNSPILISYKRKDVPHLVIEVNQKCNIRCRECYKSLSNYTKPVELIKEEIEFALTRRKVRCITLAGGEPTLHPQLTEIIEFISSKGIVVRLLSNGVGFKTEQLRAYKEAGLSGIFLHIDTSQDRPDFHPVEHERELDPLRNNICAQVVSAGMDCLLELILSQKNLVELDDVVSFVIEHEHIHRMLITCFTDFKKMGSLYNKDIFKFSQDDFDKELVKNKDIEKFLFDCFKMVPYAYLGSSHNLQERRWLYYGAMTISNKKGKRKVLYFTSKFIYFVKLLNRLFRKKEKRIYLREQNSFEGFLFVDIFSAVFLSDVKILFQTLGFLKTMLLSGSTLHIKNFIFQEGPTIRPDGEIEYCNNCPDATVRDGKLTILCLADQIDKKKRIEL